MTCRVLVDIYNEKKKTNNVQLENTRFESVNNKYTRFIQNNQSDDSIHHFCTDFPRIIYGSETLVV